MRSGAKSRSGCGISCFFRFSCWRRTNLPLPAPYPLRTPLLEAELDARCLILRSNRTRVNLSNSPVFRLPPGWFNQRMPLDHFPQSRFISFHLFSRIDGLVLFLVHRFGHFVSSFSLPSLSYWFDSMGSPSSSVFFLGIAHGSSLNFLNCIDPGDWGFMISSCFVCRS